MNDKVLENAIKVTGQKFCLKMITKMFVLAQPRVETMALNEGQVQSYRYETVPFSPVYHVKFENKKTETFEHRPKSKIFFTN